MVWGVGSGHTGMLIYTSGVVNLPNFNLASGGQATVTFATPFTSVPRVTLTLTSEDSANVNYYVLQTETDFTLVFTNIPQTNASFSLNYQILQ